METIRPTSRALFASGMIGIAIVGFVYGDFASVWAGTPKWIPVSTHVPIAYAASVLMLLSGIGLFIERSAATSARILFFYLALWALILRVPIVLTTPQIEVSWEGLSEGAVMLAGAWVLFAGLAVPPNRSRSSFVTGKRGTRLAQILFGLAMLPLALSHFAYAQHTAELVPSYLPYHTGWAYSHRHRTSRRRIRSASLDRPAACREARSNDAHGVHDSRLDSDDRRRAQGARALE